MTVIVPDDLWKDVRKRYRRCARRLSKFIETHPEQHDCIAPTGEAVMELGKLLRALSKANKDEQKVPS
jgi:hypothetical protein